MKPLLIYLALMCVAVNVAGNAMNNTAQALEDIKTTRVAQLCAVNPIYCN